MLRVDAFYDYLRARECVRLARWQGKPWPWTDDPVLRAYKFTNVRREHDRTTATLIREFYSKEATRSPHVATLMTCAVFRYFGTVEFARRVGWCWEFDPDRIVREARAQDERGEPVFTGAYVITNQGISGPKIEVVVRYCLTPLWQWLCDTDLPLLLMQNSWQVLVEHMATLPGFGGTGFMAKEVLLDTMHCAGFWPIGRPADYWTWTPVGPGARRGVLRVLGRGVEDRLKEPALDIVLALVEAQSAHWPAGWGKLSPHDVQFALCEFDKYERAKAGGRLKNRYRQQCRLDLGAQCYE